MTGLAPGLRAHVEYSNEVWNWQFAQARWAEEQGQARWGQGSDLGAVLRPARRRGGGDLGRGFRQDAPADRLVRVIATQTGWIGLEEAILEAPLVVAEGRPPPATAFDAYAVTGYFAALLGSDAKACAGAGLVGRKPCRRRRAGRCAGSERGRARRLYRGTSL